MVSRSYLSALGLGLVLLASPSLGDVRFHPFAGNVTAFVSIEGEIKGGDANAFAEALAAASLANFDRGILINGVSYVIVRLDSPGGDLLEAEKIGRQLRGNFAATMVMEGKTCASACVFILVAGVHREILPGARIIIHRPSFDPLFFSGLSAGDARAKYNALLRQVRQYMADMGAPHGLYEAMAEVPSSQGRRLWPDELVIFGLAGDDPAWDELDRANNIARFGAERWSQIEACQARARSAKDAVNCYANTHYPFGDSVPKWPGPLTFDDLIPNRQAPPEKTK